MTEYVIAENCIVAFLFYSLVASDTYFALNLTHLQRKKTNSIQCFLFIWIAKLESNYSHNNTNNPDHITILSFSKNFKASIANLVNRFPANNGSHVVRGFTEWSLTIGVHILVDLIIEECLETQDVRAQLL